MKIRSITFMAITGLLLGTVSCKKLVEVSAPSTSVTSASAYSSDATAIAVLTGIYAKISASTTITAGTIPSLSLFPGLSSDELTLLSTLNNARARAYYQNSLSGTVTGYGTDYWSTIYPLVFSCNAAIDGLTSSNGTTIAARKQLLGEAYFMRSFLYFYLVNLFGDLPMPLNSDYSVSSRLARIPVAQVYLQIIKDLKAAKGLLSPSYLDANMQPSTLERVRPTKWAAEALLARAYLFTQDWGNAEAEADSLINNTTLFSLSALKVAFLKASSGNKEAIWQLQPVNTGWNTEDAKAFIMTSAGPGKSPNFGAYLSSFLLNSFEAGDQRRFNRNWIDSINIGATTYFFPYKYKVNTTVANPSAVTEYIMMLRLGETYLIRAEARVRQGKLVGAATDLNAIRNRAGLMNTQETSQSGLLAAVLHERQVELFTEMGQRWLDLKRTASVDSVMGKVTPQKTNGGVWNSYQQLYPIVLSDLQSDPNLKQNAGY